MKSKALKRAWTNKWNNAKSGYPSPRVNIITPSCLNVEKATIFFRSVSCQADHPPTKQVLAPANKSKDLEHHTSPELDLIRIIRNTPAVTNVEECTKALTGVGAAIAAGSQDLNGI